MRIHLNTIVAFSSGDASQICRKHLHTFSQFTEPPKILSSYVMLCNGNDVSLCPQGVRIWIHFPKINSDCCVTMCITLVYCRHICIVCLGYTAIDMVLYRCILLESNTITALLTLYMYYGVECGVRAFIVCILFAAQHRYQCLLCS